MTHTFKAWNLMALLALGIGLSAFVPVTAQAEPGAHWNIKGASITTALKAELQAAIEGKHIIILTKSGATAVEILCTGIKFVDMLLKELGALLGKFLFEGCITKLNGGSASGACKPHSPGAALGTIETEFIEGLIKLHQVSPSQKIDLVELVPHGLEASFVTVVMGAEGEENECAIGEKFDLTGKLFLKDCQEELLTEKVVHLFVEGPLSVLSFRGNPATIDGSFNVSLSGSHSGMTWSGIAA